MVKQNSIRLNLLTYLTLIILIMGLAGCDKTSEPIEKKMDDNMDERLEWFVDAKLGIWIHYGIYSVNGIQESWSFYNGDISYEDYMKQLNGFTADNYDPEAWADLFVEAGAKYAVLTSKHHDGVALWDTKESDLSIVKKSPAARDLISPYAKALRERDLKVGLYFSVLDWSHPDYATIHNGPYKPPSERTHPNDSNLFDYPPTEEIYPERWANFLKFNEAQLRELSQLVDPDIWWFDGDWSHTEEQWKMKELRDSLLSWNSNSIINSRIKGYGDFETPEQGLPTKAPEGPWEYSMTINDSWGYQVGDNNHKSTNYVIRTFADCISMGGNLILGIGPKEDGTNTEPQVAVLKGLGRWTQKHAEAIYGTSGRIPAGHFYGPLTLSKDKKTLYCFVTNNPVNPVLVKGIRNKVKQVRMVGTDQTLNFKRIGGMKNRGVPAVLEIVVPPSLVDKDVSVIALDFENELNLFYGEGGAIEAN